jgi:hypothetical protein
MTDVQPNYFNQRNITVVDPDFNARTMTVIGCDSLGQPMTEDVIVLGKLMEESYD